MKHRNILLVVTGILFSISLQAKPAIPRTHRDSVNVLKHLILESDAVTGSSVGFVGSPSNTWYAFSWLINIATGQELVEMTHHKNPVLRLYAYTGLLYRNYKPAAGVTEKFYQDTTTVKTFSGCIMGTTTVADAMGNNELWYNKTAIRDLWKSIQTDKKYRKELFTALVNHKPVKRYFAAYLGLYEDGDTCVLARYEYSATHTGWHMHTNCTDGVLEFGRTGVLNDRIPGGRKHHRNHDFGIANDDQAFHVALKKFGLIGKQFLEMQ